MEPITPEQALNAITTIPSLPAVVTELMADMQGDAIDLSLLSHKIALDPALTARLLQLANSSFYGLPRQVASVSDAISLLGLRNVRAVVATAAIMGKLPLDAGSDLSFQAFWQHAIGTALCAQKIAAMQGVDPDDAYVAGLLHDIGRLVLVSRFAPHYRATLARHPRHGASMVQAEMSEMGLDHAMVGAALARHWTFPEPIRLAIAEHHASAHTSVNPMVKVVQLADEMSHALEESQDNGERIRLLSDGARQHLRLNEAQLRSVFTQTQEALTLVTDVLH